jgi:hypothetical protein
LDTEALDRIDWKLAVPCPWTRADGFAEMIGEAAIGQEKAVRVRAKEV